MRDVYIVGAYTTVFKKHPGMSFQDLAREAYVGALADAGKAVEVGAPSVQLHSAEPGSHGSPSSQPPQ